MIEPNEQSENYAALYMRTGPPEKCSHCDGQKSRSSKFPCPSGGVRGRNVPASYAQFLYCNGAVLVPVFNDPNDASTEHARGVVPTRKSYRSFGDLIWDRRRSHCMTHSNNHET